MSDLENHSKIKIGGHTLAIEKGTRSETTHEEVDLFINQLKSKQDWWANDVSLDEQIKMLKTMIHNVGVVTKNWAAADAEAKGVSHGHWDYAMAFIGPFGAAATARAYIKALIELRDKGVPKLYKKIKQDGDRVRLEIFPTNLKDKAVLAGVKGYIYLEPGSKVDDIDKYQTNLAEYKARKGSVSLVLGAGNCASIVIADSLHKLFTDKSVVLLKIHPVLEYLYETLQTVLEPFIIAGVIRLVTGGASLGKYVTNHPLIENIHLTGSDKTFEAIVYGLGEDGRKNKKIDNRINDRSVTGELGCVSPLIIVPGDWSESDFDFQARTIVSNLGFGGGYFCMTPRVIILPKYWKGSEKLIFLITKYMQEVELAPAYYPGTQENIDAAKKEYPNLLMIGRRDSDHQPWMFLKNLDPKLDQYAFDVEVWATFMAQVFLDGDTPEDFLKEAVNFSNKKLWGNLSSIIIIDPKTEKKMTRSGALPQALKDLRYGTVCLNFFPGVAYALGIFPWGGYPGNSYSDIQSGNVFVNNPHMLKNIEKTVIFGPFHMRPESFLLVTNPKAAEGMSVLTQYAVSNSWKDIIKLIATFSGLRTERY